MNPENPVSVPTQKTFTRPQLINEALEWMRLKSSYGVREDFHRDLGLLVDFITDLIPDHE